MFPLFSEFKSIFLKRPFFSNLIDTVDFYLNSTWHETDKTEISRLHDNYLNNNFFRIYDERSTVFLTKINASKFDFHRYLVVRQAHSACSRKCYFVYNMWVFVYKTFFFLQQIQANHSETVWRIHSSSKWSLFGRLPRSFLKGEIPKTTKVNASVTYPLR